MNLAAYLALALQTLIAAGTFLVAKDATTLFTPLELAWFRITLSGILVVSVYAITHRGRPKPPPADWPRLALLGALGVTINQVLFLIGISLSTPLHASLLYAFTPVLVLAAGAIWLREELTPARVAGVLFAVAGVALVLSARGLDLAAGPLRGDLLILLAVFAWAAYTLAGKPVLARYDTFTVITYAFAFGTITLLPAAPWVWSGFDPAAPGVKGWVEVLYLSVMTSGVAFTLWYYALRRLDPTRVAVFTNLQVPATALLAWMFLGDVPAGQVVLGGLLVLGGVSLVQMRFGRAPAAEARRPATRGSEGEPD